MPGLSKRDDALWLQHLRAVGVDVPVGRPICLRINGQSIDFVPMRPDRLGRLTHGLKATGPNAHLWHAIPRGALMTVEQCTSSTDEAERLASDVVGPLPQPIPRPPMTTASLRHASPAGVQDFDSLPQSVGPAAPLVASGAVAGLDVGYSERAASTGLCVLSWDDATVTWTCANARSDVAHRKEVLSGLVPRERRMCAVAVDGPLVPGLTWHSNYRACEAILSCGVLQKRGKPGPTNGGSGPRLHQDATRLGRFAMDQFDIADATHGCRIHEKAVVEAFPNLFLGTLCDEACYPESPARRRKWTDTLFPLVVQRLQCLIEHLLPGRVIIGPWAMDDHEEIAAFACAVTALCVASGHYTAVGADDDGWIILPPRRFLGTGWDTTLAACRRQAQRNFPRASIFW